jgi:hypothetical protein
VKVLHVEHARALVVDPFLLGKCLTLGTVAVPARVVRWTLVAALEAPIDVPAEHGGATVGDVREHALALRRQPVHRLELGAVSPHDVR